MSEETKVNLPINMGKVEYAGSKEQFDSLDAIIINDVRFIKESVLKEGFVSWDKQLSEQHDAEMEVLKKQILMLEGQLKPKPVGTAKKVFSEFWNGITKHGSSPKTIASLAFDAGHALRHNQSEWIDVKDKMPENHKEVIIHFKGKMSRVKGNITVGSWDGDDWDCYALLIGLNEKIVVTKWMEMPKAPRKK